MDVYEKCTSSRWRGGICTPWLLCIGQRSRQSGTGEVRTKTWQIIVDSSGCWGEGAQRDGRIIQITQAAMQQSGRNSNSSLRHILSIQQLTKH